MLPGAYNAVVWSMHVFRTLEDFPMLVINAMFVLQQQQRSNGDDVAS